MSVRSSSFSEALKYAEIATVSQMMEHMETRDNVRPYNDSEPDSSLNCQARESVTQHRVDPVVLPGENSVNDNRTQAPCATHSGSGGA